jgi:hypothetical protein
MSVSRRLSQLGRLFCIYKQLYREIGAFDGSCTRICLIHNQGHLLLCYERHTAKFRTYIVDSRRQFKITHKILTILFDRTELSKFKFPAQGKCVILYMKPNKIQLTCAYCEASFLRTPSKIKNSKSGLTFCSRKCKDSAQQIDNVEFDSIKPSHYGTGLGKSTYRRIALKHLPNNCNHCGYNKHIQILAVHHKDRNHLNNDISNLELLCHNCHAEEHLLHD